jgi:predicted metal-dependent peptidase
VVDFVACDAEVLVLRPVRNIEEAAKSLRGGGGTDMRPVFSALEAQRPQAEVVIVATDGHIGDGYPASEPDFCKTIWVVIGSQGNAECCPWGEIVRVEEAAA